MRQRFPVATLTGASLVVVAVAVAAVLLGRPGSTGLVGSSQGPSEPPATAPASEVAAAPTASPAPTASAAPTVSAEPTTGPCAVANLTATITLWEGAAGSRIAHVSVTNHGSTACLLDTLARPQLVDGSGTIRINGRDPGSVGQLTVSPNAVLTTLVAAANDCNPGAPKPPIRVAFVFQDGQRLVADPVSPTDVTDPPCNGAGSPASIDMHAWAP